MAKTPEEIAAEEKEAAEKAAKELSTTMKSLADGQKVIADGLKAMQTSMKDSITGLAEVLKPKEPDLKDANASLEDTDLETMSRKDLFGAISESIVGRIKTELFEPLAAEIQRGKVESATDRTKREIKEVRTAKGNEDFNDWGDELRAKITATPSLSIKEALTLVRTENPEKLKELDEKYKEARAEADPPMDGKNTKFGGFHSDANDRSERPVYDDTKTATEAAWEETMASVDLGDLLSEGAP